MMIISPSPFACAVRMPAPTWRLQPATLNFACRLKTFSPHSLARVEMEKRGRADMPTASDVNGGGKRPSERESERGLWPHWDHLNSRKAAAIYCPSVIMLPPSAVSLPFPVRSQAHSHQGRLAFPPASVGSARIRPSIPSALTPPKKKIVFHTIRSRWDSKCTA